MNTAIIIVSGLPRSGTSMIMQMLEAGGVGIITDNQRKPDSDNPHGYYEYEKVKDLKKDASWLRNMDGKAVKVISMLLYHLSPSMSYKILFIQRNMQEILDSQKKMLARLKQRHNIGNDAVLAKKLKTHLDKVTTWIEKQANMTCFYVNYNQVLQDPLTYADQIQQFLDRPLDINSMAAVVELSLYRNRCASDTPLC